MVLIDFPHRDMKAIGFVTRVLREEGSERELAAVYVPTTPNPTSGYLEVVPVESLTPTDWSVDQAMSFIISAVRSARPSHSRAAPIATRRPRRMKPRPRPPPTATPRRRLKQPAAPAIQSRFRRSAATPAGAPTMPPSSSMARARKCCQPRQPAVNNHRVANHAPPRPSRRRGSQCRHPTLPAPAWGQQRSYPLRHQVTVLPLTSSSSWLAAAGAESRAGWDAAD